MLEVGLLTHATIVFGRKPRSMTSNPSAEQGLIDVWEAHTNAEFNLKDADAAIATMTDHPVLIHVPVATGATGVEPLRRFYREVFIPQMPPDFKLELLSRSVAQERLIDEFIVHFTHSVQMDWFAPGIKPTGRRLSVPHVGVIAFRDGLIASEHIYWDQASVSGSAGVSWTRRFLSSTRPSANVSRILRRKPTP